MEDMRIEQLVSVVRGEIAKLTNYKYVEQALVAVQSAEERRERAEKELQKIRDTVSNEEARLAAMQADYDQKVANQEQRHAQRAEALHDQLEAAQVELRKKQDELDGWAGKLKDVEAAHQANVAQFDARIQQKQSELVQVQEKIDAARALLQNLTSLKG